MAHEFIFLTSMIFPASFAAHKMIIPSLFQWGILLVGGLVMLFTMLVLIKLMQAGQVSVVMAVLSGVVMLGTSAYINTLDIVAAILVIGGIAMLIKKEYFDQ
jgi:hypothetical protein